MTFQMSQQDMQLLNQSGGVLSHLPEGAGQGIVLRRTPHGCCVASTILQAGFKGRQAHRSVVAAIVPCATTSRADLVSESAMMLMCHHAWKRTM